MSNGRPLNPDEVEDLLDALENLLAMASVIQPDPYTSLEDWDSFNEHREAAYQVWCKSVNIIDGIGEENKNEQVTQSP